MKQKYSIVKDGKEENLIIREYGELDKDILFLLCEETFPVETVKSAIQGGKAALVTALRTHNMYPPGGYADRIAEAVIQIYGSNQEEGVEIFFDDKELLAEYQEDNDSLEDLEENVDVEGDDEGEDGDDLDNLLEDDDIEGIKKSGLKVDDDDAEPGDDDV
jgi:hypothetical protein